MTTLEFVPANEPDITCCRAITTSTNPGNGAAKTGTLRHRRHPQQRDASETPRGQNISVSAA